MPPAFVMKRLPLASKARPAGPLNPPFTLNTRTPFETSPPEPPFPNTPANQALVNDPITLLQNDVQKLVDEGCTFEGTVLNIATRTPVNFLTSPNSGERARRQR